MALELMKGDLLEVNSDAVLLTIDGGKPGMEGNIARQFARRFPEDWQYLQRDIRYPVPFGRSVIVSWDGDCPWSHIVFASTLHHVGVLEEHEKRRVIRLALTEALQLCVRHGIRSLSSAVLQGGWRLSPEAALEEMEAAYQSAGCLQVRLVVVLPKTSDVEQVEQNKQE
jgi:O-acetyl-ADP-ribose deacetylase (regulator of RNase III)